VEIQEVYQEANQLLQTNKPKDALKLFMKILDHQPDYEPALNKVGVIFAHAGDTEQARVWFQRALDVNPEFGPALGNMAGLLADHNQIDEALDLYLKASRLSPDNPYILNNLAALYKQKGDLENYLKNFKLSQSLFRDQAKREAKDDLRQIRKKSGCAPVLCALVLLTAGAITSVLL
jgi:tetratricopeptide (TPR) repeat protein